jgi:hypothetical protein
MYIRKYSFKTNSADQRPVKHCPYVWAIVGCGIREKKFWQMVIWLPEGHDVFEYYPEAYDVTVQLDKDIEIKRGGKHHIITTYKTLGFKDGIDYGFEEVNPTLLAIIENMSYQGMTVSTMAKRAGINLNKMKKLINQPLVARAIKEGQERLLEEISNSL